MHTYKLHIYIELIDSFLMSYLLIEFFKFVLFCKLNALIMNKTKQKRMLKLRKRFIYLEIKISHK